MSTQPVDGILPVELVMEIVMKIPARFLVGLRCVCKSWNALITDPQFVSTFFNRNNNTRENFMFLGGNMCHKYVAMFRINEQPRILYDTNTMDGRTRNSFNFSDCFKQCMVVGSINGIICLFSYWRFDTPFVVLWNPTISYWKLIFIPQHKDEDGHCVSIGMAFDSLTNDYKIIRLASLSKHSQTSRIEVYSAKHDAWSVVNSRDFQLTDQIVALMSRVSPIGQ
ncbi:F-box/kelch-repeat protein At3g23880-like [Apium graveolens]|uniref:F-box/kelch-repeat protein At3g23880-like n=1 Tax=Apium graveolens TaxID=4045 RepID=UPI003D79ECF0